MQICVIETFQSALVLVHNFEVHDTPAESKCSVCRALSCWPASPFSALTSLNSAVSLTLPILFLYVDSAFNQTFNFHAFPFTLLALAALKETIKY